MDPSEGIFGGFDPLAPLRSFLKSFGAFVVDVKGSELKYVYPPQPLDFYILHEPYMNPT